MVYLNDCGIVCAIGNSHSEIKDQLWHRVQSGVTLTDACSPGFVLPLGRISQQSEAQLPSMAHWPIQCQSRNNQLALAALAQIRPTVDAAIEQFGPDRVGLVIGTSTSGIANTERALRQYLRDGTMPPTFHYAQQEMGSPAMTLAIELNVSGPAYVHSSACASSGKAFASAARLINMGLCDAVICGGVDSLCAFTVAGFSALESVSSTLCNPLSLHRDGINIGEGAALFLMSRTATTVALCGWGESSDGHHMSAPDPAGKGAQRAIKEALQRAGVLPEQIDYINMHGTATVQNDAMESHVIAELFGCGVAVSSTKPFTGHALGAASAIEAALCWLMMQDDNDSGKLPAHLWDGQRDPALPALNVVESGAQLNRPVQWALSNSFAFGGSNVALIFGRTNEKNRECA